MEILSTGEKIKRIRVYNGITLKELCGKEISISKMSCIENGKIEADEDILKYIAKKLKVDYEYLAKDVYSQIEDNIKLVEENINLYNYEDELKFNLEYAVEYKHIDQAMNLLDKLFNVYKKKRNWDKISEIIPSYYDLYSKSSNIFNQLIYLFNLGEYLFLNGEFNEAGVYFNRIKECMAKNSLTEDIFYSKACIELAKCNLKVGNFKEAEEILSSIEDGIGAFNSDELSCEFYHIVTVKNILMKQYSKDNRKKALDHAKDRIYKIVDMKVNYVKCYFKSFNIKEAQQTIDEIIEVMPIEQTDECAEEFLKILKILKQFNQREYIEKVLENALNVAIITNKISLIEYAYYLKGTMLEEDGRYIEAEMNFNLALDALTKFGTKKDFYERYVDLGNLYHKIGNIKESVRYFCLAMDLKKKCKY
ncbi:MAG: transcriptional regulator [Clostridium sp.]|uniref:transcriptional regulator n=1 Tax=Clostridium sp. TaxID=1506 RepID=UPI003F3685AD